MRGNELLAVWVALVSVSACADEPVAPSRYNCTQDSDCQGLRCVSGACECEVNAQCNPFGGFDGACAAGRCVAMCPYTGSPRETPGSPGCNNPRERACCESGERCCPLWFEVAQCLPGDQPCWPSCPGFGRGVCPPDTLCQGAAPSTRLPARCRDLTTVPESGIMGGVCTPIAECPLDRRCGAQTCCAEGTVCVTSDGDQPADSDPGVGRDLYWVALPQGICCIPD